MTSSAPIDPALLRWQEPVWDLAALLESRAAELGDAPYLSFAAGGVQLSFAGTNEASATVAAGLAALGVRRGDHVLIALGNRAEFVLTWFALAKLGAVQVPVNTAYRGAWLQHVAVSSGAKLAVVGDELLPFFQAVDVPDLVDFVVVGAADFGPHVHPFAGLGDGAEALPPQPAAKMSELAAIHFTSGTTGRSKGARVPLPHMDLLTRRNAQLLDLTSDSVYLSELPLFHINAQMTVQGALIVGAPISRSASPRPSGCSGSVPPERPIRRCSAS
jgi:crotonobetaine/carnitine-CoA ligase